MYIGMIAPPWIAIPPRRYGGIERVIYDLVESFVAAGHHVTLFAPAGSSTSAELIPETRVARGLDLSEERKAGILKAAGKRAFEMAVDRQVDLIHDHTDYVHPRLVPMPVVRTIHGPVTDVALDRYQKLTRTGNHFIAISHRQRELFEQAASERFGPGEHIAFAGVIHNPLDVQGTPFYPAEAKEPHAVFVGRCHWEKGPAEAIEIAMKAAIPMKMALRVTAGEKPYFDHVIRPLLKRAEGLVEYVGEVGGAERSELFGRARALLFSSVWEEPFGLSLTESLAHGTPCVAFRRGSAPEILVDGQTGILCDDVDEMARRLPEAMNLDPARCREDALLRFDRPVIAAQHVDLFESLISPRDPGDRAIDQLISAQSGAPAVNPPRGFQIAPAAAVFDPARLATEPQTPGAQ